jgi:hypothetical protein
VSRGCVSQTGFVRFSLGGGGGGRSPRGGRLSISNYRLPFRASMNNASECKLQIVVAS